eukprot:gene24328-29408_t
MHLIGYTFLRVRAYLQTFQHGYIDLDREADVSRQQLPAGQQLPFEKALHYCKEASKGLSQKTTLLERRGVTTLLEKTIHPWSALATFLSVAQEEGVRDVSELRGWLLDGDDAAIVRPEAAVQELGRRLRVEGDGAFAARFAACSEALQRRVLCVVDLLGQALRRLGAEGPELSAQLSEHVLAATGASAMAEEAFGALRLACVGQLVAAAS